MLMVDRILLNTLYLVSILFKFMLGLLSSSKSIVAYSTLTIWTNILLISAFTINLCVVDINNSTNIFKIALTITILGLLWQLSIVYKHHASLDIYKIPSTYISWNTVYNTLLLIFVGLVSTEQSNSENLLLILSMLMFVTIIINQIILDFFMVDIYTE
tara:strand:+ start:769 stop:1242 length:474 start_codon:yes stop_codon:yes gene_type:complete